MQTVLDDIDGTAVQQAIDRSLPYRHWPAPFRQLALAEAASRGFADLRAHSLFGAGAATVGFALDVSNGLVREGLLLRMAITVPCFLLVAILARAIPSRWRNAAHIVPNAVFVGTSAWLGNLAPPPSADRYVISTALICGILPLLLPLRPRALLAASALGCAAILLAYLSVHAFTEPGTRDLTMFIALASFATMPLAMRMVGLKDRNFLLSLHVRLAQARLLDANDALRRLADSDPLTGLANRRKFEQLFDEAFDAALACGEPVAVMMMDIDHFKHFNDSHGHPAGDRCIREVAATIAHEANREGAVVARYGGEEFVTVLRGAKAATALSLSEKIRQRVAGLPIEIGPGSHQTVTLSIGLMIAKPAAFARNELVRLADQALYAAKQGGRNQVVLQSSARADKRAGHTRRASDRKVA